jgi:hypothetical protein
MLASEDTKTLTYLCPKCLSIEIHVGNIISPCKDFYYGCPAWTAAIAWKDNQPLTGSHLKLIPDRKEKVNAGLDKS